MNASHSINLFTDSFYHISTNGEAPPLPHNYQQHNVNLNLTCICNICKLELVSGPFLGLLALAKNNDSRDMCSPMSDDLIHV